MREPVSMTSDADRDVARRQLWRLDSRQRIEEAGLYDATTIALIAGLVRLASPVPRPLRWRLEWRGWWTAVAAWNDSHELPDPPFAAVLLDACRRADEADGF